MNKHYVSPSVEAMEVEVEEGFAISVAVNPEGTVHNFDSNGFGTGGGGHTLEF